MYNKDKATLKNDLLKVYENIFEEALIDEIVDIGYFDKIKKGKLLIDIGDVLTHIPLILTGVIKIMRQEPSGDELALYFLEPGDTCAISFANCLNRKQSIFKGIVEVNVEAVFIPVDVIDNWLAKYKTWRHFIVDSYHFRLLEMVESIDSLAFMKMKERIWKYLSDRVKVSNDYDLEITHQEIAFDLNSSRVVISRIVKILHEEGKIFSTRSKVKLIELY